MTETVLGAPADSSNQGESAAVSTLSTRRAYKAEHERKRRAAGKAKPSTANMIKTTWNAAPIAEREGLRLLVGCAISATTSPEIPASPDNPAANGAAT